MGKLKKQLQLQVNTFDVQCFNPGTMPGTPPTFGANQHVREVFMFLTMREGCGYIDF